MFTKTAFNATPQLGSLPPHMAKVSAGFERVDRAAALAERAAFNTSRPVDPWAKVRRGA